MNTIRDRLGQHGADIVTNAVAQTVVAGNEWFALQGVWSTTVFATLTDVGINTIAGTIASTTLVAGQVIYGAFTNFTLTSGAVRAYRAKATSS